MKWTRGFLVFLLLAGVVVASFWVSFLIGRRILIPLKQPSIPQIEVTNIEPPPAIQDLQEAEEVEVFEVEKIASPEAPPATPKAKKVELKKVEVKKPEPTRVSQKIGNYFKVQAGLFNNKAKALELAKKIQAKGFDIYLKPTGGKIRVQVGAFRSRPEAEDQKTSLSKSGFDSVIVYE